MAEPPEESIDELAEAPVEPAVDDGVDEALPNREE